jgi:magnesium chelatase family protein
VSIYACYSSRLSIIGLEGYIIDVEVDFDPRADVPASAIVGLPDTAVKESRERVRAAVKNSRLSFPNSAFSVFLLSAHRT